MDKASKGDAVKLLVIPLPHVHLLFPFLVVANHERPDPFTDQQVDHPSRGTMEIVVNFACALGGESFQTIGGMPLRIHPSQLALQISPMLVIELVDGLHWTPVNKARHEAAFV